MDIPKNIEYVKNITEIKYQIGLRKEFIEKFNKLILTSEYTTEDIENINSHIQKYVDENAVLQQRLEEKLNKSTRKKYNFPIIDVPANGRPNWWEGAYTLCFVYSKHNGNFILRGWRGEVMEYLKKNYTHYFYYVSMWHDGVSRGHWEFWKDNITIFEPSKMRKEWKYKVVKYSAGGLYGRERVLGLEYKRLPKQWIKEFDKL
ncbi:MAG: hypothetical protein ACOC22_00920 [bacterium]